MLVDNIYLSLEGSSVVTEDDV